MGKKKYFVISDIHSFYDELIEGLNKAGFDKDNPDHIVVNCGDLTDRGDFPIKCINFMLDLYRQNRAILIRGNHEDLMVEAIDRGFFESHDYHNGTNETAEYLTGMTEDKYVDYEILEEMGKNDLWNEYINACIDYYETKNYIFVHGWIPVKLEYVEGYEDTPLLYRPTRQVYNPDWRNVTWKDDWKDARWFNGMKMWNMGIREPNKTIICGHFHVSWGHSHIHNDGKEFLDMVETFYIDPDTGKQEPHANFDIFYDDGIIAIDGCVALNKKVNVLVIEDEELIAQT